MTDSPLSTHFGSLKWDADYAEAMGWGYSIQTERVRGESPYHSLLVRPPGARTWRTPHPTDGIPEPSRRFVEGTKGYAREEARLHVLALIENANG